MPPSDEVLDNVRIEFDKAKLENPNINAIDFLKSRGIEPEKNPLGKDDSSRPNSLSLEKGEIEIEKIVGPSFKPKGDINCLVVLIDFDDNKSTMPVSHFNELLFSENIIPTGSLRDYYREVSGGRVNILGQVSGWHRMPEKYSFYVGKDSGGDDNGYPNNAKKMIEDAALISLQEDKSIQWDKYDLNGDRVVDTFIVVHAGPGAEDRPTFEERQKSIWSHKWMTQVPINVTPKTSVALYLTVPETGNLGVYAHETGHLVFGWPDLYDACPSENRTAGTGKWSLMCGGSWNNKGNTPSYPDGWCRYTQGWAKATLVQNTREILTKGIESKDSDEVFVIPIRGSTSEYFLIECRKKLGYDAFIPGEGILVYHIDESASNNCEEDHLAVSVVQADGHEYAKNRNIWKSR